MTDIVERLRKRWCGPENNYGEIGRDMGKAAAEIERLRAVLRRIRRWGSPIVKGYIDGALGGSDRICAAVGNGEVGEVGGPETKEMSDIVKALRAVDHSSVEDCFFQSPLFTKAAIEIDRLRAALLKQQRPESETLAGVIAWIKEDPDRLEQTRAALTETSNA